MAEEEKKKPKIDLKARLGKKTVATGGASIPPPMGVKPGGSIPAPPFAAKQAPAPRIDPSDPYSSVAVSQAPSAPVQQAIRIEMSEEMVEAQKKGRSKILILCGVTAVIGGFLGFVLGGNSERGKSHERALVGAEMLAGEVEKANGEITKLADTLKKAKAQLADGKFPEAEVTALGGIDIPFDGNNLSGKGIGLMGAEINAMLVRFAGDSAAANEQKDRLKRVMGGGRKNIEEFLAQKDAPKFNWSVFVSPSPSGPIASMQPLPAPFAVKGTWPDEFEIKVDNKPKKLKRYTKGEVAGEEPLLIPVDPATQGAVCSNDVLVALGREMNSLESMLRGDKSDPTNEKTGLLETGDTLVTKLKAIGTGG